MCFEKLVRETRTRAKGQGFVGCVLKGWLVRHEPGPRICGMCFERLVSETRTRATGMCFEKLVRETRTRAPGSTGEELFRQKLLLMK